MVRKQICLGLVLMLLFAVPSVCTAETVALTGRVYLPIGETAPKGGVGVSITNDLGVWTTARIAEGDNSATYVLYTQVGQKQTIRYFIQLKDYAGAEYIRQGYHGGSVSPLRIGQATALVPTEQGLTGIDLYITRGVTVSGTITMPDEFVAKSGGASIQVGSAEAGCWVNVVILAGEKSTDYVLTVPPGMIRVYFDSFSDNRFIRGMYYSGSGVLGSHSQGIIVDVTAGSITGVDGELQPGIAINGTVSLKEGVAPAGGVPVVLWTHGYSLRTDIPAGRSSVEYAFVLPPHADYRIGYYLGSNVDLGLVSRAHYSVTGMTHIEHNASWLKLGEETINGVDIVIYPHPIVTGRVVLPDGMLAPAGGLLVKLQGEHEVCIPAGEGSVPYSFTLTTSSFSPSHSIPGGYPGVLSFSHYTNTGTPTNWPSGFLVQPGQQAYLDIKLPKAGVVTGRIYLPEGEVAPPDGLAMRLITNNVSEKTVVIPAGANSVEYSDRKSVV